MVAGISCTWGRVSRAAARTGYAIDLLTILGHLDLLVTEYSRVDTVDLGGRPPNRCAFDLQFLGGDELLCRGLSLDNAATSITRVTASHLPLLWTRTVLGQLHLGPIHCFAM